MVKHAKPVVHARDHEHGGADPTKIHYESVGEGGTAAGMVIPPWDICSAKPVGGATFEEGDTGSGYYNFSPNWGSPGDWTTRELSNGYYHIPTEGGDSGIFARRHLIAFPHEPAPNDRDYEYEFWLRGSAALDVDFGSDTEMWVAATIYAVDWNGSSWHSTALEAEVTNENQPVDAALFDASAPTATRIFRRFWRGWFHFSGSMGNPFGFAIVFAFELASSTTPTPANLTNMAAQARVTMLVPNFSGTVPDPT